MCSDEANDNELSQDNSDLPDKFSRMGEINTLYNEVEFEALAGRFAVVCLTENKRIWSGSSQIRARQEAYNHSTKFGHHVIYGED